MFVDCVCLHPVLSQSAVWKHFIECTDEKMWKMGKRKAEKDALVGANYFACLQVPEKVIDPFDLYVFIFLFKMHGEFTFFYLQREAN
jgi:sorting nexin-9/18/33